MQAIHEIIHQLQQQSPHQHQLTGAALARAWKTAMPQVIQQRTLRTFYKDGKFFVQLSSAPLRQSLHANRAQVIARLQSNLSTKEPLELIFI